MLAGIALILLGIVGLSYNRITYTSKEKILDIGPVEATAEKVKSPESGWSRSVTRNRLDRSDPKSRKIKR